MKSALVHYWLVSRRGGEQVLDAIADLLPEADLISHVVDPALLQGPLSGRTVRETFVGGLPFARKRYPVYLPLMPFALESMDMSSYDLIVSSEAGPAKWVIKDPDALHICYCHSPLRYIWDQRHIYMKQIPGPLRPFAHAYAGSLRQADQLSAMRVDKFVANSSFVAKRIWSYYRREAEVIPPPVNVDRFRVRDSIDDYYLFAGELRGYKGVDIAIEACTRLKRRLKVVGGGDPGPLRQMAGPLVEFTGRLSDADYDLALSRCQALLFPGVEDFGIIPVEVMASGRPVIAFAKGGVLDTVKHQETGILYQSPSVEGLMGAMASFEAEMDAFTPANCVKQAQKFSTQIFKDSFRALLPNEYRQLGPNKK